jgi:hypothetical protein
MGRVMHDSRQLPEALELYSTAHQVRQRLAENDPQNLEFQRVLANSIMNIGLVHKDQGDLAEALQWQSDAQNMRRQLLAESQPNQSGWTELQRDRAKANYNLAVLERERGERAAAIEYAQTARDNFQQLVSDLYGSDEDSYYLARCHHLLGQVQGDSRDPQELKAALGHYQAAYQQARELNRTAADVPNFEHLLGQICNDLGLGFASDVQRSSLFYQEAVRLLRKASDQDHGNTNIRHDLAIALLGLGKTRLTANQPDEGRALVREALQLFQDLRAQAGSPTLDSQIQAAQQLLAG